jgi:putative two-component system response regulator
VPDEILKKGSDLTPAEWEIMKQHPVTGEKICRPLRSLRLVLPIIRHHHEHSDGSGYPDGLRDGDIPLLPRILQVVDIYDALRTRARTSRRSATSRLPPPCVPRRAADSGTRSWSQSSSACSTSAGKWRESVSRRHFNHRVIDNCKSLGS